MKFCVLLFSLITFNNSAKRSRLYNFYRDLRRGWAIRKALKVNSLSDTVSKYRDNWLNHLTHIDLDHSRFPRYMLPYKPTGKKSPGCPRERWRSHV